MPGLEIEKPQVDQATWGFHLAEWTAPGPVDKAAMGGYGGGYLYLDDGVLTAIQADAPTMRHKYAEGAIDSSGKAASTDVVIKPLSNTTSH